MNICLFEQSELSKPLSFDDVRGNHIIKILHKKQGQSFTAGIIDGQSGTALITKIDDAARQIFFEFKPTGDGKPLNPLKMIIGFPRPIQLRRLLRDLAALGVSEVHLTGTELGEKSYMASDLAQPQAAWELLREGTVQAGSTHVPKVFVHKSLKDCLGSLSFDKLRNRRAEGQTLICLDNVNPACSLKDSVLPELVEGVEGLCNIVAAIGSERGWTDKERALLEEAGFIRCGMGQRIMRTETAATVAGAIILNAMGVLN